MELGSAVFWTTNVVLELRNANTLCGFRVTLCCSGIALHGFGITLGGFRTTLHGSGIMLGGFGIKLCYVVL